MKLSHTLMICTCLVFAGVSCTTAVTPAPVAQQQVEKWEYLSASVLAGNDGEKLLVADLGNGKPALYGGSVGSDQLGDDGWELVAVNMTGSVAVVTWFTFKRPKR